MRCSYSEKQNGITSKQETAKETVTVETMTSGNYLQCNRKIKPDWKPKTHPNPRLLRADHFAFWGGGWGDFEIKIYCKRLLDEKIECNPNVTEKMYQKIEKKYPAQEIAGKKIS